MLRDKAFHIGRINKTHGVAGQLTVSTKNKVVEPEEWPEWIFLEIDAGLVPFRVNPDGMVWRDEAQFVASMGRGSARVRGCVWGYAGCLERCSGRVRIVLFC